MSTTFTWDILKLDCLSKMNSGNTTLTDVVISAQWSVTGTYTDANNKTFTGSTRGVARIIPDLTATYKPYDQLTKDEVLNWVWTSSDLAKNRLTPPMRGNNPVQTTDVKTTYENIVQKQIDVQINPAAAPGVRKSMNLPWASPPSAFGASGATG